MPVLWVNKFFNSHSYSCIKRTTKNKCLFILKATAHILCIGIPDFDAIGYPEAIVYTGCQL